MFFYHITRNGNVEKCADYSTCAINKRFHFDSLCSALSKLDSNVDISTLKFNNMKVNKYTGEINYNSGLTTHYQGSRVFREMELIKLLGKGEKVEAFIVDEGDKNVQIQEILDNGVLNVYSFDTHKKITLFASHPDRIFSLYTAIGEFPPEWLIKKSELNIRKGYNEIFLS